jgi:MATE family multidrug resistance protein
LFPAIAHPADERNWASNAVRALIRAPDDMELGAMLGTVLALFIPSAGTMLLFFANQITTMMFVGRQLGVEALATYGVGQSILNVAGISIAQGMAAGLDTLCAQSFGRHKRGPELGEILQRGIVVCLGLSIPVMAFFVLSEPLMLWLFGEELGLGVTVFLRCSPLFLVFVTLFTCFQKALQAQQLPQIPLAAACVSVALCPVFNMYLTHRGLPFAVLSMTLCNAVTFVVTVAIALLHPKVILFEASWPSKHAFDWAQLKGFLAVGFPSMFSICSEWWAFEILVTLAAQLGGPQVAAFNIAFSGVMIIAFAVPMSMAITVGVLVGNSLGENNGGAARSYARLCMMVSAVLCLVNMAILSCFSEALFEMYTGDKNVLRILQTLVPYLLVYHLGDSMACVLQGAFRGVGLQRIAARAIIFSFWICGVPGAVVYSTQLGWGLPGVVLGSITGFGLEVPILFSHMVLYWNWEELAAVASAVEVPGSPRDLDDEGMACLDDATKASYGSTN